MQVYDDTMVGGARGRRDPEAEEAAKEEGKEEEDEDSEEALKKARDWDEFKDGTYE